MKYKTSNRFGNYHKAKTNSKMFGALGVSKTRIITTKMASFAHAWQQPNVNETSSDFAEFQRHAARLNVLATGQRGRRCDDVRGGGTIDRELDLILDDLNGLDYYTQFLTEPVGQLCCARLIAYSNS